MNDLENELRDALDATAARVPVSKDAWLRNEQLLHELPHRRYRRTWLILATVACVVGVLIAVAALALPGGSRTPPAGPTPVPTQKATPAPSSTPPASPSATPSTLSTPSAPTTSPAIAPPPNVVDVAGARLTLPSGWVAEPIVPPAHSQLTMPTWCLQPKSTSAASSPDDATCPISLSAGQMPSTAYGLSVDTPGGFLSNPEFCGPGGDASSALLDYSDSALGTRPADHRRWLFVCKDGTRWPIEQYVADNAPAYVLYSAHATDDVHTIMANIAETAQLPAISAPLRLSDFGIVRSVTPAAGSYHVLIDRVVQGIPGLINNNPQTYAYDVPASVILGNQAPKIGSLVQLTTNGEAVVWFAGY